MRWVIRHLRRFRVLLLFSKQPLRPIICPYFLQNCLNYTFWPNLASKHVKTYRMSVWNSWLGYQLFLDQRLHLIRHQLRFYHECSSIINVPDCLPFFWESMRIFLLDSLTLCRLNRLSHTIYWKGPISILCTYGYAIYILLEKND